MIDGWMSDAELAWLTGAAVGRRVVVEVGVWKGRSTHALCLGCAGTVFAIDSWRTPAGEAVYRELDELGGRRRVIDQARRNLRDPLAAGKLFLLECDSLVALQTLLPELLRHRKADMLFLDGDHDPAVVRRELTLARETLLAPDALICGHDYDRVKPALAGLPHAIAADSIWQLK